MASLSMKHAQLACGLVLVVAACASAVAQTTSTGSGQSSYPTKPVTIVVPFAAGGPTDTLARIIAERMRKPLGQPVLVDNTTGAGGTIGTGKVARAAPDGYLVSIGHWGTHVVNGAYYTSLPFHVYNDFAPVALIASNPQIIISKPSVPATNLKELVGWVRANPDKVLMGTGGVGGASHIAGVYFQNMAGGKFQYVAYRGGAPALQAIFGGEVDLFVSQIATIAAHLKGGRIRTYAVMAPQRQAAAPDIPTVDEAGLPGLHTSVWHAIWLPKGSPRDVVMKLNAAIVETLADPAVRQRFIDLGQELPSREQQTPEGLATFHKSEIDKWWPLIKAAGIKGE